MDDDDDVIAQFNDAWAERLRLDREIRQARKAVRAFGFAMVNRGDYFPWTVEEWVKLTRQLMDLRASAHGVWQLVTLLKPRRDAALEEHQA